MMALKKTKQLVLVVLLLCCSPGCVNTAPEIKPFIKGSLANIEQRYASTSHIVLFWSEDCAYCMKELVFLGKNIAMFPRVKLITVNTDPNADPDAVREVIKKVGLNNTEMWVFSEKVAQKLYYDVDRKWRGELPYMLLFDASEQTLIRKRGYFSENEFLGWLAKASAKEVG